MSGRPGARLVLAAIEKRRALGRTHGIATVEASCDDAVARVQRRLPTFQGYADPLAVLEPMDRQVAQAALEALQEWHNAEQAVYAAMRDSAQAVPPRSLDGKTDDRGWRSRPQPFGVESRQPVDNAPVRADTPG